MTVAVFFIAIIHKYLRINQMDCIITISLCKIHIRKKEKRIMYCKYCGNKVDEYSDRCQGCGGALNYSNNMNYSNNSYNSINQIPAEYAPMSAWSYFGHSLLFSIPVAGLVVLIVFACGGTENINKRNYARSYFCALALSLIIMLIMFIISLVTGVGIMSMFEWY